MKLKKRSPRSSSNTQPRINLVNLIIFVVNVIVLVYINKLKYCDIKEKENRQLKGLAIFSLVAPFASLMLLLFSKMVLKDMPLVKLILYVIVFLAIISVKGTYIVKLFKYVDSVNDTDCITDEVKGFHKFMQVWRYIAVVLFTIQLATVLLMILSTLYIMNMK